MSHNGVIDLLYTAQASGVEILLEGDVLQVRVEKGKKVDAGLLQEIRSRKEALTGYLRLRANGQEMAIPVRPVAGSAGSKGPWPLSYSQQRLWVTHQLEGSLAYHIPILLRLTGQLDAGALESALGAVVDRHYILRTVYRETDGDARQYLRGEGEWRMERLEAPLAGQGEAFVQQAIGQRIQKPFDLRTDHMLRALLIEMGDENYVLLVVIHHIAADAWSLPILMKELVQHYDQHTGNRHSMPEPLPLQYPDYAVWQQQEDVKHRLAGQREYWREQLAGYESFTLPADRSGPANGEAGRTERRIGQAGVARLSHFATENGLTLYMVLLGFLNVLLNRYTRKEDLCVVSSIAGRRFQELEEVIGFFANTLIFRTQITPTMRLADLLKNVKITAMEAFDNQDLPFEEMASFLPESRSGGRQAAFPVMLVLENTPSGERASLGSIAIRTEETGPQFAKFDLTVTVTTSREGLDIGFTYRKSLFDPTTMECMIGHFVHLLEEGPGELQTPVAKLSLMPPDEQRRLLKEWNHSRLMFPEGHTVTDIFDQQARQTPDTVAVVDEQGRMTYGELALQAGEVARCLQHHNIPAGACVAVVMEREAAIIPALLGIMKAGCAYVPLDADNPDERLLSVLGDSGCRMILVSESLKDRIRTLTGQLQTQHPVVVSLRDATEDAGKAARAPRATTPGDAAYIIYTSGTTGLPKGAVIEHRSILDYVFGIDARTGIRQCSSFALVSTIAADLGNTMIYCSLLSGATLHILSKDTVSSAARIGEYFDRHAIDCLKIVPSHWKVLSGERLLLPEKFLIFGGESLPPALVNKIRHSGAGCKVIDHYGPTETTIGKLLYIVDSDQEGERVPIGRPFGNTTVYIIDPSGAAAATGVPGELYIGGAGVARGYLHRPDLTEERFVSGILDSRETDRFYRTGDLVRWRADGQMEFLGRIDQQVKIHGYRVEPGEIEAMLQTCPDIRDAAVLCTPDGSGEMRLVAYLVARDEEPIDPGIIEDFLRSRLPDHMIPAQWAILDSLPLTQNGKVDRKKLAEAITHRRNTGLQTEARNDTERALVHIWQELLDVGTVGIHDNFFALGGHSLLAIRLISAMRKELKAEVSIGDIFDHPTIAAIAQLITQADARQNSVPLLIPARPVRIPLSFSQERLWFLHHLGHHSAYHIPIVLRIRGDLSVKALEAAFSGIIRRHEVLRTVIRMDTEGIYQEIRPAGEWRLERGDRREDITDGQLRLFISDMISQPFDLSRDLPIRAYLQPLRDDQHILIVTVHHIASDGWSNAILVREFVTLYEAYEAGKEAFIASLPWQYADYAVWQRSYLSGEVLAEKLNFWRERLAGCPALSLPTDNERPAIQSTNGSRCDFHIEAPLKEAIQAIGLQEGATLFMTLLAAFQALLYRYSGQPSICVGTATAGRQHSEFEELIGFFVNTLVLRADVDGNMGFRELLRHTRERTLEAYAHQEVPFEKVVEAVEEERDISRNPLFQVMFELQNNERAVVKENRVGGLLLTAEPVSPGTAKLDISISLTEGRDGLSGCIEYCTDLYRPATMAGMARHYVQLLRCITADAGQRIDDLAVLDNDAVPSPEDQIVGIPAGEELFDFDL